MKIKIPSKKRWTGFLIGSLGTLFLLGANSAASTATRAITPAAYTPGQFVTVTLTITPDSPVMAYGLFEEPPAGWDIDPTAISDNGSVDGSGIIRWDIFDGPSKNGPAIKILTYRATPPPGETGAKNINGYVSFDGDGQYITGITSINVDPAIDNRAPLISAVSATDILVGGVTISWTTDENSNSQVEYGLSSAYGVLTLLDTAFVTGHSVSLTGLAASTLYHYRVISKDASGNTARSSDYTFTTSGRSSGQASTVEGGFLPFKNVLVPPEDPSPLLIQYSVEGTVTGSAISSKGVTYGGSSNANGNLTIKIYDRNGDLVKTLDNVNATPGQHSVSWDGKNEQNEDVVSGVYHVVMTNGSKVYKTNVVTIR